MPDRHAIAAGHRLTAEAGAEVLEEGGTAADAAVAAAFVAMVVEPVLAGLYGGGFAMVRPATGAPVLLDAFVDTPGRRRPPDEIDFRAIHADFGATRQEFHIGAGSIAVPGLATGLAGLAARHGRMPLARLVEPACTHARAGVPVTAYQARLAEIVAPILTASEGARALHCDGDALRGAGGIARNPDFADVLEVFAAEGPRFVSEGEPATALAALSETAGGHLARADIAGHTPEWRRPLEARRGEVRLSLVPPPGLGGALIAHTLGVAPRGADAPALAAALAETARARALSGIDIDPEAGAQRLLAGLGAGGAPSGGPLSTRGTTHVSVTDRAGNGVALTLSNGEGCGLVLPGTGIMPNNMLGEADLLPGGFESWRPGIRLGSMMAPLAAEWPDGRLVMLGSGGSNRIRSALARVLVALIDGGADLETAILAPRLHVEGTAPATLDYEEPGLAEAERAALRAAWPEARGWDAPSMFFGGAHGVLRDAHGGVAAAGDPRRAGHAVAA